MKSQTFPACLAFVLLIGVTGCGSSTPEWCAVAGAEVVLDPEATMWSDPPTLERLWRIDGSADGQELVLPSSITVNERLGRIAVVDFHLGEVIVANLDGRWLGRWGRSGPGPGEIGHALAARWTDEATLEVYDPVGSKVVRFDSTGAVIGETRIGTAFTAALGGGIAWINFTSDGSIVTRPSGLLPVSEGMVEVVVLRTDVSGASIDTLVRALVPAVEPDGWQTFVVPDWPVPHAAVSRLGHVAVSGTQQEYRIDVQRPDSNDLVLCRTVAPQRSTEDATSDLDPAIRAALLRAPRPSSPASVGRVTYDEQNRLWVQRDRPSLGKAEDTVLGREGALFDVYSGTTYLGEVKLPERVRLVAATREIVIGLERNEMDEYSLIAYGLGT